MAAEAGGGAAPQRVAATLDIELAWIERQEARVMPLSLALASPDLPPSYADVLALPQAAELIARLGLDAWSVFGKKRLASDPVRTGDRVELLPPLRVDPKQARLRRLQTTRSRR